jgi:serine/threonine protein kinase
MEPNSQRWQEITPSEYPWERQALAFMRERLPDTDPYRAWANFEFLTADGTINEVDLLVLSPKGLFLVEIKSRPGEVAGDAYTWEWTHEGRTRRLDSPLLLANRKAKRLKSLLESQRAGRAARLPFVQPLVFLSASDLVCRLPDSARQHVWLPDTERRPGIVHALTYLTPQEHARRKRVDRPAAKAVIAALEEAGIRPTQRRRRVGDYELGDLLGDGPGYQDFQATHSGIANLHRRVRIYHTLGAPPEDKAIVGRAARRELELLEGVQHQGIVRPLDLREHELGPALVYDLDQDGERLDHFLASRHESLTVDERLHLVRELAEAVRYAHDRMLVHRALSPRSVVIANPDTSWPIPRILDWQVGFHAEAETGRTVAATQHVDRLVDESTAVYMAPEAFTEPETSGVALDVFSLGAIAFHVFSGRPPAASALELAGTLREHGALQLAAAVDGAPSSLHELIARATSRDPLARPDTVADFLHGLTAVEDELTAPEPAEDVDPLAAKVGDIVGDGSVILERLGSGATAIALRIERNGRESVLKVARGPEHEERLRDEGEVLAKLRHPGIVEYRGTLEIGGRVALELGWAGEATLGEQLRREGRLHLDLLERFGEDLLEAIAYLEQVGIAHRDVKPDNLGVLPRGKDEVRHLVLFDFSLARAPAESIRAGTAPYVDPFLTLAGRGVWDLHAERFAVAVTLYELATGTLPRFGDGIGDPAVLEVDAAIERDLFEPALADNLVEFFARALRREAKERFGTAQEMLRAWQRIFEAADRPALTDHAETLEPDEIAARAGLDDPVLALGASARVTDALHRAGAETVHDLLSLPLVELNRLRGVGNQTRRDALRVVQALRARFRDEIPVPADGDAEVRSVDLIVARLVGRTADAEAVRVLLGLDDGGPVDLAVRERAAARWAKSPPVARLREDVVHVLDRSAGVATAPELAAALLDLRGSAEPEPMRGLNATAAVRAACVVEERLLAPRFLVRASLGGAPELVVRAGGPVDPDELAAYVELLGGRADELAEADPLLSPARVVEELREVPLPDGLDPLSEARLVRLAAAASTRAAASSRLELYPRGMAAGRALRLGQGALLGARAGLTTGEVHDRVRARFPDAQGLPGRPDLDGLLEGLELALVWDEKEKAYLPVGTTTSGATSATGLHRRRTGLAVAGMPDEEVERAAAFEERVRRVLDRGGFLALLVAPELATAVAAELDRRFAIETIDLDRALIHFMKVYAHEKGAGWDVVTRADAAPRGSREWTNLQSVVRGAFPQAEAEISAHREPVLLTWPGLLARYDQMGLLERLRDRAGTAHGPSAVVVLVTADSQRERPTIDGEAVPVLTPAQWARAPRAWVENRHRGGEASAA